VTGWALLFPERLPADLLGVPGIGLWALVHTYTGFCLSLFMVVHVYLGTTGATLGELFSFMWFGEPKHTQTALPVRAPTVVDVARTAADSAETSEANTHVEVGAAKESV
jgi:thiosulfate reductase cytochrome b subunit